MKNLEHLVAPIMLIFAKYPPHPNPKWLLPAIPQPAQELLPCLRDLSYEMLGLSV